MDRSSECQSSGFIRNMMLQHEETFRHQVHELHRLHKVQKMLMSELRSKRLQPHYFKNADSGPIRARKWSSSSTSEINCSSCSSNENQYTLPLRYEHHTLNIDTLKSGQHSKELGTCSQEPSKIRRGSSLECPVEEASTNRIRTIIFGKQIQEQALEGCDGDDNLNLTLSLGQGANKK